MIEINAAQLVIPAFIAGLFTFLAPCTFPLVPGYLGFISGVSFSDLSDPEKAKQARGKILKNGVMFVLGFSAIFITFGLLAGLLGASIAPYRIWLTRIGGAFVILFGLFMLNVIKIPFLQADHKIKTPKFFKPGKPFNSFILGAAFAIGWTPCVGPILASILLLASATSTAIQGAYLLAIFSLGLAIPFLALAIGFGHLTRVFKKLNRYLTVISIIGGIFLIFIGLLLLTGNSQQWFGFAYRLFDFINYEGIYDFL